MLGDFERLLVLEKIKEWAHILSGRMRAAVVGRIWNCLSNITFHLWSLFLSSYLGNLVHFLQGMCGERNSKVASIAFCPFV